MLVEKIVKLLIHILKKMIVLESKICYNTQILVQVYLILIYYNIFYLQNNQILLQILAMSRVSSDASNNSQGLQRMLYDSFDDVESIIQPPMPTLKRSLSYVDTIQPVNQSSTTTWLQQTSLSAAHSEHGINYQLFIFKY